MREVASKAGRAAFAVLVGSLLASGPALADEVTLPYQAVMHTTEWHSLPVPGDSGHDFGIAAFRGLALFADGRIATFVYGGHFDFVDSNGPFGGHAFWIFDDGSTLKADYVGEATAGADGGITFDGEHRSVTGTGEFADMSGQGSFDGRRVDHLSDGGDTYFRGELVLSGP